MNRLSLPQTTLACLLVVLTSNAETLHSEIKPQPHEITHHLPRLSSVFPQGSQPGMQTRVEILGEYLDRAQIVLPNDSSIRGRVLSSRFTRLEVELEVDRTAAFGPHYFGVLTPRGASNILLFRVGDLPHRTEHEPNNTFEEAEEVPVPVTINGRLNVDGDFDFYRFRAEKGQTWVFDLRAARNGNGLDAALILLDSSRHELARSEDFFYWDPFFTYTFTQSGLYYVVVQPSGDADPNLAYQLDIRMTPHLETISPLSLKAETTVEATIFGMAILDPNARLWFDETGFTGELLEARDSSASVRIYVPAGARPGEHELAMITSAGRSDIVRFLVDTLPRQPRDPVIHPPVAILGTAHYHQPERFFFDAKANQMIDFEVRAQRYGSPVDSILRILDAKGKEIAKNDDAKFEGFQANKDSAISHVFKEEGRYELQMRNLWAVDGENYPYELIVRPAEPGCELMLDADQPYVYAGGTGTLKVTATRSGGFEGPIKLQVSGLPDDLTAEPAEIPAAEKEGSIRFHAGKAVNTHAKIRVTSPVAREPAWRPVTITSDGGSASTIVRIPGAVLAVVERPTFALEPALTIVSLVRGRSVEIPLQIERESGFKTEIHFAFENLPPGVTADGPIATAGSNVVKVSLHASREAPVGKYAHLTILGSAGEEVEEAPQIAVSVE